MIGETAVNIRVKQMVFAGDQLDQLLDHPASSAIAGIPADAERTAIKPAHHARDIIILNVKITDGASTAFPIPSQRHRAQFLNIRPVKRCMTQYHLEAIILGGIVAAGYLNAAINAVQYGLSIIKHWSGA